MMNNKMIETALGMLARFVPPEEYAKLAAAITQLAQLGQQLDTRLQAIEAHVAKANDLGDRLTMLETIVRDNVSGADAAYSEQAQWLVPGRMDKALAPAVNGALNHDDGNTGG